ncbi:MAG: hypothetical protein C0614_12685 [Desulfuromonas sp.]|nr:MAG: hypothetical protein C0614_12685 [Desulfuromonas sp.]
MLIALLMLLGPVVVFLAFWPLSNRLLRPLRRLYRLLGAAIVFGGSTASYSLANYSGDQGGIAALFCQVAVISGLLFWSW